MKKINLILSLIFFVMCSLPAYAKWTQVTSNDTATFYVNFESIQRIDGHINFWVLIDSLKPTNGVLSTTMNYLGDCRLLRYAILSGSRYPKPMGKGKTSSRRTIKFPKWYSPQPTSETETILKAACKHLTPKVHRS